MKIPNDTDQAPGDMIFLHPTWMLGVVTLFIFLCMSGNFFPAAAPSVLISASPIEKPLTMIPSDEFTGPHDAPGLLSLWFTGGNVTPYLRAWINTDPVGVVSTLLADNSIPQALSQDVIRLLVEHSPHIAAQLLFGELTDQLADAHKLAALHFIYPQAPLLAAEILSDEGLGRVTDANVEIFLQQAFSEHFLPAEMMFLAEPGVLAITAYQNLYLQALMAIDLEAAFNMLISFSAVSGEDEHAALTAAFIHRVKDRHHLTGHDLLRAIERVAMNDAMQRGLVKDNFSDLIKNDMEIILDALHDMQLNDMESRYFEGTLIESEGFSKKINEEGPMFFLRYLNNDTNISLAWGKFVLGILRHDYQGAIETLREMPAGQGRDAIIENILMENRDQYDRVFAELKDLISNDFERSILGSIY